MTIVGIDPGFAKMGLSVARLVDDDLVFECAKTIRFGGVESIDDMPIALENIYNRVREELGIYSPDIVIVEYPYFRAGVRQSVLIKFHEATGVIILASKQSSRKVILISPREWKIKLGGRRVSKQKRRDIIKSIVEAHSNIKSLTNDSADAAGLIIYWHHYLRGGTLVNERQNS